jgi:hypothetical protein
MSENGWGPIIPSQYIKNIELTLLKLTGFNGIASFGIITAELNELHYF